MQQVKPHTDAFGRVVGTLILLVGIAMLIGAFYQANAWLHSPLRGFQFLDNTSQAAPPPANIGAAALEFVRELMILGFMTMIGSILSGKGISLYLGAIHWGDMHRIAKPAVESTQTEPAPIDTPAPASVNPTHPREPSPASAKPQNG